MLLSRFWYVILGLAVGVALYVVFLAVGQYNRRNTIVMKEGLASDSQTVEWALKIDSRRRLDQLAFASLDAAVQKALADANGKEKIPAKSRDEGRKALVAVLEKIPAEFRPDALFAIDRDGRVIAQVGYDAVAGSDEFELGGYPAAFDALHGFVRDDTWVLGSKMYLVGARPVEYDVAQRPVGAILGLKELSKKVTEDLAKRTRTNLAFFAGGQRMASATGVEGFEESQLELITNDMPSLTGDASYESGAGRSDVHMLSTGLGAIYARLPGDAWEQHAGFAVLRPRVAIQNPMGFISGADDKDKASVPWGLIVVTVFIGIAGGIGLTLLEHDIPVRELVVQAQRLRSGGQDGLQVARFRGAYRRVAQDVNQGLERVVEKTGGIARRPADLESILGPMPAKPAMSAFSLPTSDSPASAPPVVPPVPVSAPGPGSGSFTVPPVVPPVRAALKPEGNGLAHAAFPPAGVPVAAAAPVPAPPAAAPPAVPAPRPPSPSNATGSHNAGSNGATEGDAAKGPPGAGSPAAPRAPRASRPSHPSHPSIPRVGSSPGFGSASRSNAAKPAATASKGSSPAAVPAATPTKPALSRAARNAPTQLGLGPRGGSGAARPQASPATAAADGGAADDNDDERTMIAPVPADVMAQASRPDEGSEWQGVFEDFVRTKKECGESTDGLTFEKFKQTLKKNQDALIQRHACKRVRFSVYVKDGRASLKASPLKD